MATGAVVAPDSQTLAGFLMPDEGRFTVESARFLLSLTFDQETQDRAQELMDKNSEGQLTAAEKEELEQIVNANTYLGILQSKARLFLKKAGRS